MKTVAERLWEKVDKTPTCWVWTASKNNHGYGRISINNYPAYAHRVAYELARGPIPKGMELDHLCRNPSCVRPDHLEPVSHRENGRRGMAGWNMREKTHCPQGHPYDAENTRIYFRPSRNNSPHRYCRTCQNALWKSRGKAKQTGQSRPPQ